MTVKELEKKVKEIKEDLELQMSLGSIFNASEKATKEEKEDALNGAIRIMQELIDARNEQIKLAREKECVTLEDVRTKRRNIAKYEASLKNDFQALVTTGKSDDFSVELHDIFRDLDRENHYGLILAKDDTLEAERFIKEKKEISERQATISQIIGSLEEEVIDYDTLFNMMDEKYDAFDDNKGKSEVNLENAEADLTKYEAKAATLRKMLDYSEEGTPQYVNSANKLREVESKSEVIYDEMATRIYYTKMKELFDEKPKNINGLLDLMTKATALASKRYDTYVTLSNVDEKKAANLLREQQSFEKGLNLVAAQIATRDRLNNYRQQLDNLEERRVVLTDPKKAFGIEDENMVVTDEKQPIAPKTAIDLEELDNKILAATPNISDILTNPTVDTEKFDFSNYEPGYGLPALPNEPEIKEKQEPFLANLAEMVIPGKAKATEVKDANEKIGLIARSKEFIKKWKDLIGISVITVAAIVIAMLAGNQSKEFKPQSPSTTVPPTSQSTLTENPDTLSNVSSMIAEDEEKNSQWDVEIGGIYNIQENLTYYEGSALTGDFGIIGIHQASQFGDYVANIIVIYDSEDKIVASSAELGVTAKKLAEKNGLDWEKGGYEARAHLNYGTENELANRGWLKAELLPGLSGRVSKDYNTTAVVKPPVVEKEKTERPSSRPDRPSGGNGGNSGGGGGTTPPDPTPEQPKPEEPKPEPPLEENKDSQVELAPGENFNTITPDGITVTVTYDEDGNLKYTDSTGKEIPKPDDMSINIDKDGQVNITLPEKYEKAAEKQAEKDREEAKEDYSKEHAGDSASNGLTPEQQEIAAYEEALIEQGFSEEDAKKTAVDIYAEAHANDNIQSGPKL